MERPLRLALHQLNPTVGDLAGNAQKVRDGLRAAREAGAQLSLFPELMITGYPPEDLLIKEHFLRDAREALDDVASEARDLVAIVGFPERAEDVYNAAAVLADGRVQAIYRKVQLPNYGVFDEVRYFQAARLRDTRQRPAARAHAHEVDHLGTFSSGHGGEATRIAGEVTDLLDPDAEVYAALVLGTRDYVVKNGFEHVVIGLSGGIDSTLVLCVAVDALGAQRVTAVTMPSRYSSEGTRSDAKTLAANLGVELHELAIEDPMRAYDELLTEPFRGREADITE